MKAAFGQNIAASSKDKFYSEDLIATNVDSKDIKASGKVTATSFVGDGAGLTNVPLSGSAAIGGVFYENDINVTKDYTITESKNAMSAGPLIIDSSVTITVPSNSTWIIV